MMNIDDPGCMSGEAAVGEASRPGGDRLRRAVHAALAIYLLPALVLVMIVGGTFVAVGLVARGAAGLVALACPGPMAGGMSAAPAARRAWIRGPLSDANGAGRRARVDLARQRRA